MRKTLGIAVLLFAWAAMASATDFRLYGSYWNTSDVDDAFGGGIGLSFPLGASPLSIDLAGTYYQELSDEPVSNLFDDDEGVFQDEGLEVLPFDAGLHYNFQPNGPFNVWIGGGFTYFLIDTTREGIDVDDETGFHVSVGSRFGSREGANFFAEALYRSTEATLRRERRDNVDLRDEVAIDLDGVAVNAGILWTF
jgi:hypothetical protein